MIENKYLSLKHCKETLSMFCNNKILNVSYVSIYILPDLVRETGKAFDKLSYNF